MVERRKGEMTEEEASSLEDDVNYFGVVFGTLWELLMGWYLVRFTQQPAAIHAGLANYQNSSNVKRTSEAFPCWIRERI